MLTNGLTQSFEKPSAYGHRSEATVSYGRRQLPRIESIDSDEVFDLEHVFSSTFGGHGRTLVKLDKLTGEVIVGYGAPSNVGDFVIPPIKYVRIKR